MPASDFSTLRPSGEITYLLVVNGKPEGPYTITELRAIKIKPNDFVRSAGMDDYKEVHEIAELRSVLGINKQAHIPQYFGSFDQRLLASALDWLLVCLIFIPVTVIVIWFITDKQLRLMVAFSLVAIIPIAKLIYHIVAEASAKQATYGKQLLKIRVGNLQGERLSMGHSAGRNLAKALSVLTFFIGYLFSFFNQRQQCLHDMVAGTLVIKDRLM